MNSFSDILKSAEDCTEAYEVVRVFEVVKNHETYRFEVLQNLRATAAKYSVHVSQLQLLDGAKRVWVKMTGFPWTDRETPESAMAQAMGFFREYR